MSSNINVWESSDRVTDSPVTSSRITAVATKVRNYILNDSQVVADLASVSFPQDDAHPSGSPEHQQRQAELVGWLANTFPTIMFRETSTASLGTRFLSPDKEIRKHQLALNIRLPLLQEISHFETREQSLESQDILQFQSVLFVLARSILREIGQSARVLYANNSETDASVNNAGVEAGAEFERRTGGVLKLFREVAPTDGGVGKIAGIAMETTSGSVRYISLDSPLLRKLASVDWHSINYDVASASETPSFSANPTLHESAEVSRGRNAASSHIANQRSTSRSSAVDLASLRGDFPEEEVSGNRGRKDERLAVTAHVSSDEHRSLSRSSNRSHSVDLSALRGDFPEEESFTDRGRKEERVVAPAHTSALRSSSRSSAVDLSTLRGDFPEEEDLTDRVRKEDRMATTAHPSNLRSTSRSSATAPAINLSSLRGDFPDDTGADRGRKEERRATSSYRDLSNHRSLSRSSNRTAYSVDLSTLREDFPDAYSESDQWEKKDKDLPTSSPTVILNKTVSIFSPTSSFSPSQQNINLTALRGDYPDGTDEFEALNKKSKEAPATSTLLSEKKQLNSGPEKIHSVYYPDSDGVDEAE